MPNQEAPDTHRQSSAFESAAQIGKRFNVSRRTVHHWYASGIIQASIHVGKVLRFDPQSVQLALQKASRS